MDEANKHMNRRQLLTYSARASIGLAALGALGLAHQTGWPASMFDLQTNVSFPSFRLQEISRRAGVAVTHQKVLLDHQLDNIMPWMASVGAAVAAADYNNDGFVDVFVSSSGRNAACHLYRNNGDGTFTDVAAQAGVADLNRE